MKTTMHRLLIPALAGGAAGIVTGIFGTGGGLVLIPLLTALHLVPEDSIFPASVCIMLPICLTSIAFSGQDFPWVAALPYLIGSCLGGLVSTRLNRRLSPVWLHRGLGILMIWGAVNAL